VYIIIIIIIIIIIAASEASNATIFDDCRTTRASADEEKPLAHSKMAVIVCAAVISFALYLLGQTK